MLKKLSLAIIVLIFVMSALCIPVLADPGDNSSAESTSSISTEESTPSDETSSGELSSGDENSDASTEENSSQFYIPDDSDYFTESLNSLGGTVTSGTITIESGTSATTVSKGNSGDKNLFDLEELIKKWLWAPIALICICILVLVILDRIYIVKYKRMDPEVKYKAQQKALKAKAAAKQKAAKRSAESKHGRTRQDTHNDLD